MKIKKLHIQNYRNITSETIEFNESCNFIVGENNIGKSNILDLLNTLFSRSRFQSDDFNDDSKPLIVEMKIKLSNEEIGHFADFFDTDNCNYISISCRQDSPDDHLTFSHSETGSVFKPLRLKCLNYIPYNSLRNPTFEVNFDRNHGVGRFLVGIVKNFILNSDVTAETAINQNLIKELLGDINDKLSKLKAFNENEIKAYLEEDVSLLLPRLITLQDSKNFPLSKSGYGLQFLLLITLSILDKLQNIAEQPREDGIFENPKTGEKSISVVLGLDEPEIHLHPYMQRSLIKYLNRIINNEDSGFKSLIKELFNIDRFDGQIIVVTHSPNIIFNDYRQIIRLYRNADTTKVISGSALSLDQKLEKHLLAQFPFIKEAFFARCIIFVEGDTEYGCFPIFAEKCGIDLDDCGICVIKSGGRNSMSSLMTLAEKFAIPCVGIVDDDEGRPKPDNPNIFQTKERDFEAELVTIVDKGHESILRKVFEDLGWTQAKVPKQKLIETNEKYHYVAGKIETDLKLTDIDVTDYAHLKLFYVTCLRSNKSQLLSLLISKELSRDDIPDVYVELIETAKSLC